MYGACGLRITEYDFLKRTSFVICDFIFIRGNTIASKSSEIFFIDVDKVLERETRLKPHEEVFENINISNL